MQSFQFCLGYCREEVLSKLFLVFLLGDYSHEKIHHYLQVMISIFHRTDRSIRVLLVLHRMVYTQAIFLIVPVSKISSPKSTLVKVPGHDNYFRPENFSS